MKEEELRSYLKRNGKFFKLTAISKAICNRQHLLGNFVNRQYNGSLTYLGEEKDDVLSFFETELGVTFNPENETNKTL